MPRRNTYLYHKEYKPTGRIFDLNEVSLETLESEGWVDDPAKIGVNMWGGGVGVEAAVKARMEAVERGDIDRMGGDGPLTSNEEANRASAERDATYKRLRVQEDENEALKREIRELKEKRLDHESDASKIMDKPSTGPVVRGADLESSNKASEGSDAPQTVPMEEGTGEPDPAAEKAGEAGAEVEGTDDFDL